MTRCEKLLALVVTLSMVSLMPRGVNAQGEEADVGIRWVRSAALPELTIGGIVVDAETNKPLAGAQVFLADRSAGILTDEQGLFRLDVPMKDTVRLVGRIIGYAPDSALIEMQTGQGVAVQIGLRPEPLRDCGLMVCAPPCNGGVVRVVVRDALTGRAPTGRVVLRVKQDSTLYWSFAGATKDRAAVSLAAGEGSGPFIVEVAAPGYGTWRRSGVEVERDECGFILSPSLAVWLLPTREP